MSMDETSIFDYLYPTYKITKPIRLIEFFAGYGSQALALKYLGTNFEHWKICEWAVKSIQAYKDIHFPNETLEVDKTKEELVDYLYSKGISANYNEPMKREQIARRDIKKLKEIYANIIITHNLVNIQQVNASDLEIIDQDKYTYVWTYSFPCQDLSLAGKRGGMKDNSTRSGMLWEVERILVDCKINHTLPDVLIMENVPQVHGSDNNSDFARWQLKLESLGYQNYWKDLNSKNFGVPQNRERCFMVSLRGGYNYSFPKPIELRKRLKDLLEENVDEKYYLSEKMVNFFSYNEQVQKERGNIFKFKYGDGNYVASTITTKAGSRIGDNFIIPSEEKEDVDIKKYNFGRQALNETLEQNVAEDGTWVDVYNRQDNEDCSGTITTRVSGSNNYYVALKRGYECEGKDEQKETEGIDVIGNYSKSGYVQTSIGGKNGIAPTITENHGQVTAISQSIKIKTANSTGYIEATEGDGINISSRMQYQRGTVQKGMSHTITCTGGGNEGVIVND